MQILFIFSLLFAILVAVFAVLNSDPVTINLMFKQIPSRQSIVILGSAAVGAVIVALLGVFNKVKSSLKIRELNNKIKVLERKVEELNNEKIEKDTFSRDIKVVENNAKDENKDDLNELDNLDYIENEENK